MNKKSLSILFFTVILLLMNSCSFNKNSKPDTDPSDNTGSTASAATQTPVSQPPKATPVPTIVPPSPEPTLQPTPAETIQAAEDILKSMSLEEKVGQLFFVRCRADQAIEDIEEYAIGGYILFANDFKDKTTAEIKAALQDYQFSSKIPLLIGVDEEGGTVNRVSKYPAFRSTPFQSPQELYSAGGFPLITKDTIEKAKLLKSLGINVNLAPVCDVSTNPDDFIYPRSFGRDSADTSEYVNTIVTAMNSQGIGCTLKHFPGYGNNVDTHTGIAIDNRSMKQFKSNDFLPFEAGIKSGAGSVLVSHNIVTCMDDTYPASLSPAVHKLLRKELGFRGVIMTDDLSMEAIKQYTDNEEAAVLALQAGNDLLIATDFDVQIPAVVSAVKNNVISEERIDESVRRILLWKQTLGLITKG